MKIRCVLKMMALCFFPLLLTSFTVHGAANHNSNQTTVLSSKKITDKCGSIAYSGWWKVVQKNIQDAEYNVTRQENTYIPEIAAAFQAPNRTHNLRIYFTPSGIQLSPRRKSKSYWTWGMVLKGYGFIDDVRPVEQARLGVLHNTAEYFRNDVSEWYKNDKKGLEQGFTLHLPPKAENPGPTSWVTLKLSLHGNLKADFDSNAGEIEFNNNEGLCVLRYGKLFAFDSTGRKLPSKLTLSGKEVFIHVDAGQAVYPIIIDPLITSPDWIAESNQTDSLFGLSVATAGDVNGDGYSDVIVGARAYDNGQTDEGMAFVFHGSASGLNTAADWTAECDQELCIFGGSVATAGDVNGDGYSDVVIGARGYDNGQTDEGMAFVFHGSASGLSTVANWTTESNQIYAKLGNSVATAGDVNGDGYSDVIIGDDYYDDPIGNEGAAFVYHGSSSGLSTTYNWMASEANQGSAHYARSVSTAGDVNGDGYDDVIVGADEKANGQIEEGMAYVYYGSASGLSTTADWTDEGDQANAKFGRPVATAGDINGDGYSDVIIGAYLYDNGQTNEGRVFVYYGSPSGLSTTSADWMAESNQTEALFGSGLSSAGDINGDGYSDIIVGAQRYDNDEEDEGMIFIYLGSISGLNTTADWTAESDQSGANFGVSVSTAGDVDGDGYSDVIVGAHRYDNGEADEGSAFVYHGPFLSNHPPTCSAGDNLEIVTEEICMTTIIGTAADEDPHDTLQYKWTEGTTVLLDWAPVDSSGQGLLDLCPTSLEIGTHTLTLAVSDGSDVCSDNMILTIDNSAPHAAPSGAGVYEIATDVTLQGNVSDFDGDLLDYIWMEGTEILFSGVIGSITGGTPVELPPNIISNLALGLHTIILQVNDNINSPVDAEITVEIVDITVPTLAPQPNLTILWPPNHRMVDMIIEANAEDNSGLPVTLTAAVSSNEPEEGTGDGDMIPDWTEPVIDQETGSITLQLRAERSGSGDGREYTITITATDVASNSSSADTVIIVPHDKGIK